MNNSKVSRLDFMVLGLVLTSAVQSLASEYSCELGKSEIFKLKGFSQEIRDHIFRAHLKAKCDSRTTATIPLSGPFSDLNAVGAVSANSANPFGYDGTGFLISPCHMITAHHVINNRQAIAHGTKVKFSFGYTINGFSNTTYGNVIASGSHLETKGDLEHKNIDWRVFTSTGGRLVDSEDYAIVQLDTGHLKNVPFLDPRRPSQQSLKEMGLVVGYPRSYFDLQRMKAVMTFTRTEFREVTTNELPGFNFFSTGTNSVSPGNSGGPLLVFEGDEESGKLHAIGITLRAFAIIDREGKTTYNKVRSPQTLGLDTVLNTKIGVDLKAQILKAIETGRCE